MDEDMKGKIILLVVGTIGLLVFGYLLLNYGGKAMDMILHSVNEIKVYLKGTWG